MKAKITKYASPAKRSHALTAMMPSISKFFPTGSSFCFANGESSGIFGQPPQTAYRLT